MRFRTIAAGMALLSGAVSSAASDPLPWEKVFGGAKDDLLLSIVALPDNGYVAAGGTDSKGAGGKDLWVLRVDAKVGGPKDDSAVTAKGLVALPDGGFVATGVT